MHLYGAMNPLQSRLSPALAGRYTLDRELGEGGMAIVYLAHDLRHDRQVALKVLRPEISAEIGAERFLREIKMAAGLTHPHILPVFDSGEADGLLFYVMPNMEGRSLRERLDAERQLPLETRCRSRARSPRRSTTRTATTWCTGTSSRRTSCSTRARRWSPTSASARR